MYNACACTLIHLYIHAHTHVHTESHTCTLTVTHTHTHAHTKCVTGCTTVMHYCIACEYVVLNTLTEDSQTSELANMWQYDADLNHQITVELVELATNKVAIVLNKYRIAENFGGRKHW